MANRNRRKRLRRWARTINWGRLIPTVLAGVLCVGLALFFIINGLTNRNPDRRASTEASEPGSRSDAAPESRTGDKDDPSADADRTKEDGSGKETAEPSGDASESTEADSEKRTDPENGEEGAENSGDNSEGSEASDNTDPQGESDTSDPNG